MVPWDSILPSYFNAETDLLSNSFPTPKIFISSHLIQQIRFSYLSLISFLSYVKKKSKNTAMRKIIHSDDCSNMLLYIEVFGAASVPNDILLYPEFSGDDSVSAWTCKEIILSDFRTVVVYKINKSNPIYIINVFTRKTLEQEKRKRISQLLSMFSLLRIMGADRALKISKKGPFPSTKFRSLPFIIVRISCRTMGLREGWWIPDRKPGQIVFVAHFNGRFVVRFVRPLDESVSLESAWGAKPLISKEL